MLRTTATPRVRALTLAALVLMASACGSADTSADTSADVTADVTADTSAGLTTDAPPATETEASTATEATTPATDPTAIAATAAPDSADTAPGTTVTVDMTDLTQCLTGRWTLGADQVQRVFDDTPLGSAAGAAGASVATTGSGLLDLRADGTYTFSPADALTLTVDGEVADGQWSGTQMGVWETENSTLTMTEATNDISGTITLFGSAMPLPLPASFSGAADIVACSPMTFEIATDGPIGVISQVLVLAE